MDFNFKPVGQFLAALTITCGMVIAATDAQSFGGAGKVPRAQGAAASAGSAGPLTASAEALQMSDAGEADGATVGRDRGGR